MAMQIYYPRQRRVGKRGRYPAPQRLFGAKRRVVIPRQLRGFVRQAGFYGRYSGANPELKFFDNIKANAAAAVTGTLLDDSLVHIAEGNGESDRVGRKITLKSLAIKGNWFFTSNAVLANMDNRLRIIVYCDKQTNGAAATMQHIISQNGAVNINAFANLANSSRFQILFDKTWDVTIPAVGQDAAGTFDNLPQEHTWTLNKRLNLPIEYDATATDGSIATIRTNNIGVFAVCSSADVAPTVGYTSRVRYSDS